MEREEVIKKLHKLKELADKGIGGEKVNAERLYKKLLREYEISENELTDEEKQTHVFVIKEDYLQKLIRQIVASKTKATCKLLVDNIPKKARKTLDEAYGVKNWNVLLESTKMEFIQIMFEYDIYKQSLQKSLDAFLYAFFDTNDLLVSQNGDSGKMTKEEKERIIEAMGYSMNMDKTIINKQIEKL